MTIEIHKTKVMIISKEPINRTLENDRKMEQHGVYLLRIHVTSSRDLTKEIKPQDQNAQENNRI
jgi:hypothetical protein